MASPLWGRATPDSVFSRLFVLQHPRAVLQKRRALRQDPSFRETLKNLKVGVFRNSYHPETYLFFFEPYSLPAKFGKSVSVFVYAIYQDRKGYLWFGTQKGVGRYNGFDWTAFSTQVGHGHNRIRAILEDRNGHFWFGTYGGGVTRYDPTATSEQKSFRTQKEVDRRPPSSITRPTAIDLSHDSALIVWRTNEPATSEVIVRSGPRTSRADATQQHSVLVTGLRANTTYRYEVKSTDAAGNTGRKTRLRFRTRSEPDTQAPNILEGPFLSYRSDKQITVSLRTDEPTRVEVIVFSSTTTLPTVHGFNRSTHHNITVTGLGAGVGYSYRIVATDGAGNQTVAGNLTGFTAKPGVATKYVQPPGGGGSFVTATQPDTQSPVIVSGPTIIAATSDAITIEWSTDESADSDVTFGIADLASRIEDGADVTDHRVVLSNLTPGQAASSSPKPHSVPTKHPPNSQQTPKSSTSPNALPPYRGPPTNPPTPSSTTAPTRSTHKKQPPTSSSTTRLL